MAKELKTKSVNTVARYKKNNQIDDDNYFDFVEALDVFLRLNWGSQWDDKYEKHCEIDFRPSLSWTEDKVIKDNPYYNEINEDNYEAIFNEIMEHRDTKGDI